MIAVDTNILVYAHRADSIFHEQALACLKTLAEGTNPWAITWSSLHEFFSIVTHPRIYKPPTPSARALEQIAAWIESPTLVLLSEGKGYFGRLKELVREGKVSGPRVHDARIAALCKSHGVTEIYSADRDFSRFPSLKVRNPLAT